MEEQVVITKAKSEQASLNIKELFFKYVRFLPLYILCVALSLFGAYLYLRYATEYYRSSGQLIIRDEKSTGGISDKLEQAMQSDARKNIQTEIAVLQSRPLMERVVVKLDLNFNYYIQGKIKELNAYKIAPFRIEAIKFVDSTQGFVLKVQFINQQSFRVNESAPISFGQVFKTPAGEFRLIRTSPDAVASEVKIVYQPTSAQAGSLLGGLSVVPSQGSGILTISMESTNAKLAADVINALMQVYQDVTIEDKNAATRKTLDFIDANLKVRAGELDSITRKLVAYQKANNIIAPETQSTNYFSRVETAHQEEQKQRMALNNALQLQRYLQSSDESVVPSTLGLEDPTLNSLVASYNAAQLERKALLENARPGHIIVQQKNEEIGILRNKLLENIKNIKTSYSKAIGTLQSSSGQAVAQIRTLPNKTQDLLDIQNQLEGKLRLYNEMLAKRDLSAVTLASTISNTKVMQEALPNSSPVKPNRRATQILSLFIGLLVPTLIIFVIELLNDKIRSRQDIERLTDATILGEVGHSNDGKALVVTPGNRKVIAEQFRIIRSNLQYVLTKAPKPVVMVTSSFSGEGKSFISTNMGAVMALANKKTIILEFDIRKPKIMSGLELPKRPGLSNYILGKVSAEDLPVPVPGYDKLFVLPCGPLPPNPSELLLDTKLDELFAYLRENFDTVIMDTAPVGMVSDALTLSKYADCTLYIVRQGHTYKKQINLIDEYYREGKLPKLSIVVNDVKVTRGYGSYGYGGNYGYGYGSGYFEDEVSTRSNFDKWFGWLGMTNGTGKKQKRKKV